MTLHVLMGRVGSPSWVVSGYGQALACVMAGLILKRASGTIPRRRGELQDNVQWDHLTPLHDLWPNAWVACPLNRKQITDVGQRGWLLRRGAGRAIGVPGGV